MNSDFEIQVQNLIHKVKHYLITYMGKSVDDAAIEEFYRAICFSLREEVMINWAATCKTYYEKDPRILYYFSMEYLPGRLLRNSMNNLQGFQVVQEVVKKMGYQLHEIIRCEAEPGLGNGGLGRLAACYMDGLTTQHYPAIGYGLRYQYGMFEQKIIDNQQQEWTDTWLLNNNPWEFRADFSKVNVEFGGHLVSQFSEEGKEIYTLHDSEMVRAIPYDIPVVGYAKDQYFTVSTLRLWSTKESPRNFQLSQYNAGRLHEAAENTMLTDVLYPSDDHEIGKKIRLKQEFLLVSASIQDIFKRYFSNHSNLDQFADKVRIQINDTHPALTIAELMRWLTEEYHLPWKKAWEITQSCISYTNHTILKEALEMWDISLMRLLLPRQMAVIERLNYEFCQKIRERYPNDEERVRRLSIVENGQVRMAHLAIYGSHPICGVNGVAKLHTKILKEDLFSDFHQFFPEKFVNITNGITPRRWLYTCNPELTQFITERIGGEWITCFDQISNLRSFASDLESQQEFLRIKQYRKGLLEENLEIQLLPGSLVDVQIKRIHEYKRQLMNILHTIMLYHEIKSANGSERIPRTFIFAGKAAAGYVIAKNTITLIKCVARMIQEDPVVSKYLKVIFIENYRVSKAEYIIPASDLSEQISTAGMEASGTGNMKLAVNGALTIGTNDGANIEMQEHINNMWWPFAFGLSAEKISELKLSGKYSPMQIVESNPKIEQAVETLLSKRLFKTEQEKEALLNLHHMLLHSSYGNAPDPYFTLKDLDAYYYTQQKVEDLYKTPLKWAEYALHNIAGMGYFSADRSIKEYVDKIWGLSPLPPKAEILEEIRNDYAEHDRCRIATRG